MGDLPDRMRQSMRLLSEGAFTDKACEMLLSKMHTGEKMTAYCKQSFIGGNGDGVAIEIEVRYELFRTQTCNIVCS